MADKTRPQSDERVAFSMKIQRDLLDKVKQQAIKNRRSTGKEIEAILDEYFQAHTDE